MKFNPTYKTERNYINTKKNRNRHLLKTASNRNVWRSTLINNKHFSIVPDNYGGFKLIYNGIRMIPKDRPILEYLGYVLTENEYQKYYNDDDKLSIYVIFMKFKKMNYYIDAGMYGSIARFINHNCEYYNTIFKVMTELNEKIIIIKTIDNIYPGDEILTNYGNSYFDPVKRPCLCKSCN